jgi:hypothetical protein
MTMSTSVSSSRQPDLRPASVEDLRARWWCRLGGVALALLLATAVPLHVCMPLYSDVIQYDISAQVVLKGGVHYRDVADINLPGMVWAHAAVRSLLGWSSEAFRLADVGVVSAIIGVLVYRLRRLGRSPATQVWAAVLLYGFYFSTSEAVQGQRDTWMLLPALLALGLRQRQLEDLLAPPTPLRALAGRALLEGLCWGAAFWIKPFVVVPALACWLLSAALTGRASPHPPWLRLTLDGLALLGGGLFAGALGILWLVESGSWPFFWQIMAGIYRDYYSSTHGIALVDRLQHIVLHFMPWSLVYAVTVPLAIHSVWALTAAANLSRASLLAFSRKLMLAGFFLGWFVQTALLQVLHEYVLAPTVLLAWALLLALAPPRPLRVLTWVLLVFFVGAALWRHPLARYDRLSLWGRCWTEGSSPDLRNRLQLTHISHTPDWIALRQVADFLRRQELSDGELTCFSGSSTSLYLDLDVKPSTPAIHFDVLFRYFPGRVEEVRRQLNASPQRFVVTDLQYARYVWSRPLEMTAEAPQALPRDFPEEWMGVFPWSEPIVFHSGRYLVHRVTGPVEKLP